MISARDPHTFVSDLLQVTEAFQRRGLRFIPRLVLPAKLLRQQIKMKLQLFINFTVSPPAVQASK